MIAEVAPTRYASSQPFQPCGMNTGKRVRTPAARKTGERMIATITVSRPLGRSSHPIRGQV